MSNARLYGFWGDLTEALQTGKPQNEIKQTGRAMFEELYADPARLEQFMDAMSGISMGNFAALAETLRLLRVQDPVRCRRRHRTAVDGRSPPGMPICAARPSTSRRSRRSPSVRSPRTGSPTGSTVASGDFFSDPLPRADVITMGLILHDWNLENKLHLIRAAYDALPEGGALIAVENLIDDGRRENAFGLLMSLNMLIEFGEAFDFTGADFAGWCREVGFRETEILPLNGPASAGVAYK